MILTQAPEAETIITKDLRSHVQRLTRELPSATIISLVVQGFVNANRIALSNISPSSELARTLSFSTSSEPLVPVQTLKEVESVFELLIDADRKRKEGVVYTPDYIIDHILEQTFADKKPRSSVLDPACGAGGFLVRALLQIAHRTGQKPSEIYSHQVYGSDLNDEAVTCARLMVELLLLQLGDTTPIKAHNIHQGDTLLPGESHRAFLEQGFDIIVSNPPYVKLQNLSTDYANKLVQAYPDISQGSFSLAMLFLFKGYKLLSADGTLGYITQNNLFTSLAAENLRRFLIEQRCIKEIVDFGHKQVFSNASAYTCLIFLTKSKRDQFLFSQLFDPVQQLQRSPLKRSLIESNTLSPRKWRLASHEHLENLKRLESNGTQLGAIARIRVGFATLKDSVFLLTSPTAIATMEAGAIRRAYKIADLSSESSIETINQRVIFPYERRGSRWVPIPEEVMKERFPNVYSYLLERREELSERSTKELGLFYEWGRVQCMEAPGPKLLTKTFNRGPNFILDESDALFCNGYSITPNSTGDLLTPSIAIRALAKILNSCVMDYYAKLTSFQIEGDYQCYQKNFIERFCIPTLSPEFQNEICSLSKADTDIALLDLFSLDTEVVQEITGRVA